MKVKKTDAINVLSNKVVKFNKMVEEWEIDFDEGMLARVKSIMTTGDDDIYEIVMNFSEFEQYNLRLMKPNYYNRSGVPCEKWSEQKNYNRALAEGSSVYVQFEGDIHWKTGEVLELPFDLIEVNSLLLNILIEAQRKPMLNG